VPTMLGFEQMLFSEQMHRDCRLVYAHGIGAKPHRAHVNLLGFSRVERFVSSL